MTGPNGIFHAYLGRYIHSHRRMSLIIGPCIPRGSTPQDPATVDEGAQHLSVTMDGGQTVAVTLALEDGTDEEGGAYVIHLTHRAEDCRQLDDRLAP
jgi:hypothetical protein